MADNLLAPSDGGNDLSPFWAGNPVGTERTNDLSLTAPTPGLDPVVFGGSGQGPPVTAGQMAQARQRMAEMIQTGVSTALGFVGGIEGYHGTPHTFSPEPGAPLGAFKDQAIGSGEGAQAYGWGHYVAGNKNVAQGYADKLADANAGNLYHVDIAPDEHELLDWDKPLGEQSPGVKDKLLNGVWGNQVDEIKSMTPGQRYASETIPVESETGEDIYHRASTLFDSPQAASQALHSAGIPGIKYLDAGSRRTPDDPSTTRNYVIFHPSNLRIVGRNGQMLGLESVDHDPFAEGISP